MSEVSEIVKRIQRVSEDAQSSDWSVRFLCCLAGVRTRQLHHAMGSR